MPAQAEYWPVYLPGYLREDPGLRARLEFALYLFRRGKLTDWPESVACSQAVSQSVVLASASSARSTPSGATRTGTRTGGPS